MAKQPVGDEVQQRTSSTTTATSYPGGFYLSELASVTTGKQIITIVEKFARAVHQRRLSVQAMSSGVDSLFFDEKLLELQRQKLKNLLALKPEVITLCKSKRKELGSAEWTQDVARAFGQLLIAFRGHRMQAMPAHPETERPFAHPSFSASTFRFGIDVKG